MRPFVCSLVLVMCGCTKPNEASSNVSQSAATSSSSSAPTSAKSEPFEEPTNKDFRLASFPPSMQAVGSVIDDPAHKPFVEIMGVEAPARVRVDQRFVVRVFFKVLGTTTDDFQLGAHLDTNGRTRMNVDHAPMGGGYPTSKWKAGELLVDAFSAQVKRAGTTKLYLMLNTSKYDRLEVTSGPREDAGRDSRVVAATIEVE